MTQPTANPSSGLPVYVRFRPWLAAVGLASGGWALWNSTSNGVSIYDGVPGLVLTLVITINLVLIWSGRRMAAQAGSGYSVRAWEASNGWTARGFDINRKDYDPEGSAWADFMAAARAHGYELATGGGPTDEAWHFVRREPANA